MTSTSKGTSIVNDVLVEFCDELATQSIPEKSLIVQERIDCALC